MTVVATAILVANERDTKNKSVFHLVQRLRMTEHQKSLRKLMVEMSDAASEDDVLKTALQVLPNFFPGLQAGAIVTFRSSSAEQQDGGPEAPGALPRGLQVEDETCATHPASAPHLSPPTAVQVQPTR